MTEKLNKQIRMNKSNKNNESPEINIEKTNSGMSYITRSLSERNDQ